MRILIIGGTFEAVAIANALDERGHHVTTIFDGADTEPEKPNGKIVTGGFADADAASAFLTRSKVEYIVDAAHPFATDLSDIMVEAANQTKLPLLRLERPHFDLPQQNSWTRVKDHAEAAEVYPAGAKIFLAVGRQNLEPFLARHDAHYVLRAIEKPENTLPENFDVLLAQPPFILADELTVFRHNRISHLVANDSGGQMTALKLEAAFMLNVQVILISRPEKLNVPQVATVAACLAHFDQFPVTKNPLKFW